jgi:hypothetical protein
LRFFAKDVTLSAVSWMQWLDEAAIAEKRADLVTEKVSPHFHKRVTCINQSRSKARKKQKMENSAKINKTKWIKEKASIKWL